MEIRDHIGRIIPFDFNRDYPDLIEIEIQRFDQPMTRMLLSFLRKRYGDEFWYALDATGNQQIDAYLIAGPEQQEDMEVIHIYSIAVRKELEGKGWAYKLMQHLIAKARNAGKAAIILEVRDNNPHAYQFYQKLGFEVTGTEKNYYEQGVDAIKMSYFL